jgi:glycerol kinase
MLASQRRASMPSPHREHTLGIDEGTTGVRAVALHASGTVAGHAYVEISQKFPAPGWLEQDAAEIWSATREVARRALAAAKLAPGDLGAIGVTNQRGSAVIFRGGPEPAPLGPVIGWQDQRTIPRCAELMREGIFATPLAAATKLEWLVKENRDARRCDDLRCATIDAWLAHCLTGGDAHASDHSNASCSGLYDLVQGIYDERTIEALGLDPSWLPRLVDSSTIVGETATDTFGARVPVASLSGDQHAAMYAQAIHAAGGVKLSLGTSAMMDAHAGAMLTAPPVGAYPLVLWSLDGARAFCFEGTTVTAGAAVQWSRDVLGLVSEAAAIEPRARSVDSAAGVWVVPAFQGLGTPHLDARARATIGGLSRGSTRAHLAYAFLEGIAWRCREVFDALADALPIRPEVLRVDGGASANGLLLELLADALGIPVERPAELESAAVGAARLAGRAIALWSDADVAAGWKLGARFEPRRSGDERSAGFAAWQRRVALVREAGS